MILDMLMESRNYIKENEIATLSSKVRNDREMDSRFRGNDIGSAGMTNE